MIVPLFVGREKSVRALEEVMQDDKDIILASQIDPNEDAPTEGGIYSVGVLASVLQLLKLPDGTVKVLVEGLDRVKIKEHVKIRNKEISTLGGIPVLQAALISPSLGGGGRAAAVAAASAAPAGATQNIDTLNGAATFGTTLAALCLVGAVAVHNL